MLELFCRMPQFVWIAIAGALGALCRWGISRGVYTMFGTDFAWGTLIANVLGCFLIGFLMHIGLVSDKLSAEMRTAVAVGFLGALTTFSTFSYETIRYVEDSAWMLAILNIGTNLVIGLGATVAGLFLAKTFFGGSAS